MGAEWFHADGQTNIRKVTVAFRNFALEQAMNAQRGKRGIALLFLEPQRWMWVEGWLTPHPCRFAAVKETPYPLYRRLDGSEGGKFLPPPDFFVLCT